MKYKNIQDIVDENYDKLFKDLIATEGDDWFEILVEVKVASDGLTVRRSWKEREEMLKEEE
jgi:hypothetical protein